jgi:rubrerythrin
MTLEEAIKTAVDYETRIRDIYREAAEKISDPRGKKILQFLGDDEQHHVEYLLDRLELWGKTGKLSDKKT